MQSHANPRYCLTSLPDGSLSMALPDAVARALEDHGYDVEPLVPASPFHELVEAASGYHAASKTGDPSALEAADQRLGEALAEARSELEGRE